jgi:hypothetical protein
MARSPHALRRAVSGAFLAATVAALLAGGAARLSAQGSGTGNHVRVGVTFGGISTVGLSIEYVDEHTSLDLTFGTWAFRDVSAAIAVRAYFGAGDLLPFVGAGLWLVGAHPSGERTGFAAVLHAPVGLDWQAFNDHYLGLTMNVNRALWVRRTDPEDDLPLNRRLVPLPGVYYRWGR